MKFVVLGAGVVGVTTAYELARDGHDVTIIDRCEASAMETSHANGGQLSWSHGEPLSQPGVIRKALKWLGRSNAPLLYHLRADPSLWAWTLRFLANSSEARFWRNGERVLRVALYARQRLHDILREENIPFDNVSGGIISLYQNPREFDLAVKSLRIWQEIDAPRQALDRKGCIESEPALAHSTSQIVGGILTPHDEVGDCFAFTQHLAARTEALGATFRWNTTIHALEAQNGRIQGVKTDKGNITADAYIVALGSYSPLFVRTLGMHLPIYPAKGYSVTLPITNPDMAPRRSITSQAQKIVMTRLGDRLRVAGTLELGGYDTHIDDARARLTLDAALEVFPHAGNPEQATFWTGLRPQTPDSVPIIGHANCENLFLNTGHGMLGWTMATGTARIVADLATGKIPAVNLDGLGWERFA